MEHHEPPRIDSAETAGSRRFARFVAVPTPRRLALTRLGLVGVASLLALVLIGWLGASSVHWLSGWVNGLPRHQLPFRAITLTPPPPHWFRGGAPVFLDRVRESALIRSEGLSVLDCDLKRLTLDFQKCAWVRKVSRVRRAYPNQLEVALDYRQPVAEAVLGNRRELLIDGDAVLLPREDVDRESLGPLIAIHGLARPYDPRPGQVWKVGDPARGFERPDEHALAAARLAAFLMMVEPGRGATEKPVGPPRVEALHPAADLNRWFVLCAGPTWVLWGDPEEDGKPGRLTAEAKWRLLVAWFRARETQVVTSPDYLDFTKNEIVVRRGRRGP